jgi:hypothetical protein
MFYSKPATTKIGSDPNPETKIISGSGFDANNDVAKTIYCGKQQRRPT